MAATTTKDGKVVQVTYSNTDDDDWNHSSDAGYANGMTVRSISFQPGAANDILIVTEGALDGASIVHWKASAATDTKSISFGSPGVHLKPYIDYGNCTFATASYAAVKIIFTID